MFKRLALSAITAVTLAIPAHASPEFWVFEWPDTDFENSSIDNWGEILSGGPPKDGIPSLSDPNFVAVLEESKLDAREPVITVEIEGEVPRAYPIRYLTWHEIVNDVIGDTPVAVTFCPLCNSGLVFDRRVEGALLSFGVSGKLRNSDMVMFDRETESWWQQAVGEGIVGHYNGVKLTQIPAWMESWEEFTTRNPEGAVMMQPPWPRNYGQNPYVGYDSRSRPYPFFNGEEPPHDIPALARVLRVGESAWPVSRLREEKELSENGLRITWNSGQASALDSGKIAQGKDVGTIRVFDEDGNNVSHDVMFAFAFHAFWPEGNWMLGQ